MSEKQTVTIEIDGRQLQAPAGAMLIDVADEAGINIPRFCYHKKLSVAANCRMCLVEVAKVPKPLPACATSVNDGMQVFTRSPLALAAQKGTMEFLLINHPLDCPICDQGGECELQDVAVGYGNDVSRYVEGKRVVKDKDIGPLVATDLTRCIHCTRCVRFGAEIAGIRELGATGRGEHMTIGTYIEKSIDSELSGNIIDVCPVGSLTSKPFRFHARAWELTQFDSIAPHDALGSNVHLHVRRNALMRVHPKENEGVNECWLSDRDRFSYTGVASEDRLTQPMLKREGEWKTVEWSEALEATAKAMKSAKGNIGALISPSSTLEETHLLKGLLSGLESLNIDARLRQSDFRAVPKAPWLGMPIAEVENLGAALLIGSNPRKDAPLLGHRLRKAVMKGANIAYITPMELDLNYPADQLVTTPAGMLDELAAVAGALGVDTPSMDAAPGEEHQAIAEQLKSADKAFVLLGSVSIAHPDYSLIIALAGQIAKESGAVLGILPEGANGVGTALMTADSGMNSGQMLANSMKAYLLMGVEPGNDFYDPAKTATALKGAGQVIALSAYRSPSLEEVATIMLPMATFGETSGSFINAQGDWQSFVGVVMPVGEARPAWKILRVLGNLLDIEGFQQESSEQVLAEVKDTFADSKSGNEISEQNALERQLTGEGLQRVGDVPIYAVDALIRRAEPLQQTHDAVRAGVYLNAEEAQRCGINEGDTVIVAQAGCQASLPVFLDPNVPDGAARIPAGVAGSEALGEPFGQVTLEKA